MPRKRVGPDMRVRLAQCATCVFRPESEGGIELSAARRLEIQKYLLEGTNHICHTDDDKTICRGGRDFQLQCWSRMGLIAAPTDAALRDAMRAAGVQPGTHI